jgi:hypothetical protein
MVVTLRTQYIFEVNKISWQRKQVFTRIALNLIAQRTRGNESKQ